MNLGDEIDVQSLHTAEMIANELSCLVDGHQHLCPGHIAKLALVHSPLLFGGPILPADMVKLEQILGVDSDVMDDIFKEMELVNQTLEILPKNGKGTVVDDDSPFTPEWLTDLFTCCSRSMPSLSWQSFLWETPMVLAIHLSAAGIRSSGGKTPRPENLEALFSQPDQDDSAHMPKTQSQLTRSEGTSMQAASVANISCCPPDQDNGQTHIPRPASHR